MDTIATKTDNLAFTCQDTIVTAAIQTLQASSTSYAAATQNSSRPEHADIMARTIKSDSQVLICMDKTTTHTDLIELTEKDLVAKANIALDLIVDPRNDK